MTDEMQVTTISLRGVEYPVTVDGYGKFHVTAEDHELSSDTLRELRTMAERVPRRKVAVRFATVHPPLARRDMYGQHGKVAAGEVSYGTATGFHAVNTGSLLVDWDGASRKGAQSGGRIVNTVRIADDTEALEIRVLLQDSQMAQQAVFDWIEEHRFDPHQAVRDALSAKGDDDGEA